MAGGSCRYYAVDGGSGAGLLALLATRSARLWRVDSPRHAELLLVLGPVGRKLGPSVLDAARALPHPSRALVVETDEALDTDQVVPGSELLPGSRVLVRPGLDELEAEALREDSTVLAASAHQGPSPTRIPQQGAWPELGGTELLTWSLGPLQPLTAGPLELRLVCEGEQVVRASVEAGYARRQVALAMEHTGWAEAAALARRVEPLAPWAAQLAYVHALESLQGVEPSPETQALRRTALALERAMSHLAWLVRFSRVLALESLEHEGARLLERLTRLVREPWPEPPEVWLAPARGAPPLRPRGLEELGALVKACRKLHGRTEHARLLKLRTRGLGRLEAHRAREAGITGPVLKASLHGEGDVRARLLTRLEALHRALEEARTAPPGEELPGTGRWEAPRGAATGEVEGPRGRLRLELHSLGGPSPSEVRWHTPSRALLALLPELLAGTQVADAEVIVASLDLSMAEADG